MTENHSTEASTRPGAVMWFKVYCGVLCFTYIALAAMSLIFFFIPPEEMDMPVPAVRLVGVLFLVMGLLLSAVCALPFFVAPRPWVWVYGMVLICLGMTSACFLPACIPLLIFWIKPEAKRYFGKS